MRRADRAAGGAPGGPAGFPLRVVFREGKRNRLRGPRRPRRTSPELCENQSIEITYQERIGEDGRPLAVPVIPPDATLDEIEAIVAAEGAAVLSDEQAARLEYHFRQGITPDGIAL